MSCPLSNISISAVQIISYTKDSVSIGKSQFRGRLGFTQDMPSAVVSLLINSTQEADSGRFLVQVIIPGDDDLTAELRLNVVGEDTPLGHVWGAPITVKRHPRISSVRCCCCLRRPSREAEEVQSLSLEVEVPS